MPEFTNPSVIYFLVFRGVVSCLRSNAIKSTRMPIADFPLLKVPHFLASAAEYRTLRILLHYLCIGPFILRLGLIGLGEGQLIRCK